MSMIVHVRWVGGVVNVHVDKIWKKAMFEETTLNKTFPESCNLDYILRTKFGYKAKYDGKTLNHERKFGVGGFMNVHVDIGRWSMKCPYLST